MRDSCRVNIPFRLLFSFSVLTLSPHISYSNFYFILLCELPDNHGRAHFDNQRFLSNQFLDLRSSAQARFFGWTRQGSGGFSKPHPGSFCQTGIAPIPGRCIPPHARLIPGCVSGRALSSFKGQPPPSELYRGYTSAKLQAQPHQLFFPAGPGGP